MLKDEVLGFALEVLTGAKNCIKFYEDKHPLDLDVTDQEFMDDLDKAICEINKVLNLSYQKPVEAAPELKPVYMVWSDDGGWLPTQEYAFDLKERDCDKWLLWVKEE